MRNVIMIATDQQRADAMGCVDPSYYTPNLDRLAAMGVRFTGAISTSAQCTPSRASWMTGKYPHQVGVNQIGHVLDPGEWGIAKAFNEAGFETAYFGKWHLGLSAAEHEFQVTGYRTDGVELDGANKDPRFHSNKDAHTTAQALNYLEDYNGGKPFFMKVSWYMPHPNSPEDPPFERIERYEDRFPLAEMPIPASYELDDLSGKPPFQRQRSRKGESELSEALVRRDAQRYRSLLALMDTNLGRLLAKLEAKGLMNDTAILFTSDHGDMQGAHRLRLKGVLPYKELYNVPLVLYVPGEAVSRKLIPDLVSSAAIPGTLLAAAGVEVPEECEGGSLLPRLGEDSPPAGEHVFFEHHRAYWGYHPLRGVQTPEWKYVYYFEDGLEEMYHLAQDPDELVNVAGRPDAEEERLRLRQAVDAWWEATGGLSRTPIEDPDSVWGKEG
ncbi:choline-sulfatase [Paenibacillus sp. UNCCL117]|uniref:sulfatase family protein n=1 Tax=unclassified Paenibacillus TaxID=185978 RepID=UPI00088B82E7|nr:MULTISPECIES: sulfatase-like hydrolase/transferase [unclassified Paenibacillus]SDE20608.1 choline-sulfatase [Paenibacillus sp. cl123]SFW61672.1 choline-sulfatase [Paenibacillus sp. UNCCL117]